jgi:tripartite-type tricarboxylate transporter receptor subunit TctC
MATSLAGHAWGQGSFPSKPITIIVTTGPGASNDLEARLYGEKITLYTKQQVLVDYKPGAGTTIANNFIAKSVPDGHTLGLFAGGFAASAALYESLPYDPVKDFAPVSLMSKRPTIIVANNGVPYKNIAEYLAYAKANPMAINVATIGAGSSPHLNAEWLHSLNDSKVTYVHYKSAAALTPDLLAGRLHISYGTVTTYASLINAGKIRALGIGNAERSALLPNLSTAQEQGIAGYDYSSWIGVFAAGRTPAPVVAELGRLFARVAKEPDVIKSLAASGGGFAVGNTPEQFSRFVSEEIERYRRIAKSAGIKLEGGD